MSQEAASAYEFRRKIDDVVYRFEPCENRFQNKAWKRNNLDVWIVYLPNIGWCTVDAFDTVNGLPWNLPLSAQSDLPPTGEWVSKKLNKSYVYDLVRIP